MNKLKKKIMTALEDKLTSILFGTANNTGEVITYSQAETITSRAIGFWKKARPYMYLTATALIIFLYLPKVSKLANDKIILIILFMIYSTLFLTYKQQKGKV